MKRVLLFVLPILAIIVAGLTILGIVQVRSVRERLMDDLMRKARTVAESTAFSARDILESNNLPEASRLVDSFQRRERTQGCILYDREINVIAVTERIAGWKEPNRSYLKLVLETKTARGDLEQFGEYPVYRYIQPVFGENDNPLGLVEIVYDTSYLYSTLAELWRRISYTLIGLVCLIVLVSFVIERQTYILPLRHLTSWFGRFQKGEADKLTPFSAKGEFGKLVSEVEQVALSLRVARRAVSDEAHARLQMEDIWTETKLRDLVNARLRENSLFVVSNREPYIHTIDEGSGGVKCVRPASGVVTAIDPIMRACGGTWIAHGSGNVDRRFVNSKRKLGVPPGDDRYILKRVWLTKEEEDGYYYGFSNEGLWPLCHITHTRPIFRENDWRMYEKVNRIFAESVLEELPVRNPFVFIQDYHFTLLPRMIKERRPDATVALFWHIPWPNPEVFAICPYRHEILDGMLACDLIGFHVQFHCNNFLDTVNRLLEARVDMERFSIVRGEKETFIHAFPISIDGHFGENAPAPDIRQVERIRTEHHLEGKIVAVGVDRVDYTKGIIERILAIDRFLEKYPDYRKRFVFIQIGAPSRTHIKRYHDFAAEVDELIQRKNWKYSDETWQPIIYLNRNLPPEEIRSYYEVGDLCIVSSLHDGMNLVAKEYVASKRGADAMLILSQFTGASRELTDAVLINPYSIEEFADAIKYAIEMPTAEKRRRMKNMHTIVEENNVYRWAANTITELTAMKKGAISSE
ncbi:MAG: trehalose-6-phosphate synthase [Candidatus Krumholzibacteria bacterium]|nr:trehalose-6-phosphate synthase [Candidatus Krumholzibacteria bacterium]